MRIKKDEFGGSLLVGKRKSRRPIKFGKPTHIVLKAESSESLLPYSAMVKTIIERVSLKTEVSILITGIHADHVHLSPTFSNRNQYHRWVRALTGRLAQKIPQLKWKLRPYTRPTFTNVDQARLKNYIQHNANEGEFILSAHNQVHRFKTFAEKFAAACATRQ